MKKWRGDKGFALAVLSHGSPKVFIEQLHVWKGLRLAGRHENLGLQYR